MSQYQQMTDEHAFRAQLAIRNRYGNIGRGFFFVSNFVGLLMLIVLILHVLNSTMGYVILENRVNPAEISERPLQELSEPELAQLLQEQLGNRIRVVIRDQFSVVPNDQFVSTPLSAALGNISLPQGFHDLTINEVPEGGYIQILQDNLDQGTMLDLVISNVIQPTVVKSWLLLDSLLNREAIEAEQAEKYPDDTLEFRSWLSLDFITSSVSSSATTAGLRTSLLGSMWIMLVTAISSLIVGISAAIYLEEYASDNWINNFIEVNIRNLAAIPSVIYGMLGLAVFVRALSDLTSGAMFGVVNTNGRTVLSAGLTLALLILPQIIVNGQEALRAVPRSLREASYGLGATRLQTVFRTVLPAAIPGIMTGVILAISRAVGETAPLLVVGASTFIGIDPNGIFSKFTVVPIQIYQWTSRPELVFKNVAAAAIIVLLVFMLTLNALAIFIRNRYTIKY